MLYKMKINGLAMDPASNAPILILSDENDTFSIPIWIGLLEAASIASVLQKISFERPMTHDLFINFIGTFGATITHIEVCDLKDNTFFAKLYCSSDEKEFILDSRPSDAIALALRANAAIFVEDKVVEALKLKDGEYELGDESDQGKKWEEYLKNLSPDDFGKYKV